jgi:hypothetical protein
MIEKREGRSRKDKNTCYHRGMMLKDNNELIWQKQAPKVHMRNKDSGFQEAGSK